MDEIFRDFEWPVANEYHWQDWLDSDGRPVPIPTDGLCGLRTESAVEYTWRLLEEQEKKVGPVIGPVLDSGTRLSYRPMSREHAALFRQFAELDYASLDEITKFARKYGRLGLTLQEQYPTIQTSSGSRHYVAIGESHIEWAREVCLMRSALELVRVKTPEEIATEVAAWKRHGLKVPHEERRRELAWLFDFHLQHVQARMRIDEDGRTRLSFAPLTLLAAMWLQLALSVTGSKEFRACKFCRRVFEISTEQSGFRKHREFCTESCKTQDYRRRKRTAIALKKRGKRLAEIAAETATSKETVRRWIAGSTAKRGDRDAVPTR